MKKKLLTLFALGLGIVANAQFTTGAVSLTANRTIKIDTDATMITMTLTGSSTAWLGIGFGGTSMGSVSDMFIWNSTASRDYTSSGQSTPTADMAASQNWIIASDIVTGTSRTVVATRSLISTGDYTFLNNNSSISIIYAEGSSTTLGYHGQAPHSSKILQRTQVLATEDFSLNATSIYPNPSNGSFSVQTKTNLNSIDVYSQTGQLVKSIIVEDKSNKVDVQVNGLSTGIYLIELKNDSEKSWKKVIVE